MMKRVLSAALALSLVSGSVAFADPYDRGGSYSDRGDRGGNGYRDRGGDRGWGDRDRGNYRGDWGGRYHRHNDAGTAIAVGVGIFALMAIAASQDRGRERSVEYRRDGDYRNTPPPPPQYYGNRDGSQQYDGDGR